MGSHSVTCHPTQVNAPRLHPSQTGWYSIYSMYVYAASCIFNKLKYNYIVFGQLEFNTLLQIRTNYDYKYTLLLQLQWPIDIVKNFCNWPVSAENYYCLLEIILWLSRHIYKGDTSTRIWRCKFLLSETRFVIILSSFIRSTCGKHSSHLCHILFLRRICWIFRLVLK